MYKHEPLHLSCILLHTRAKVSDLPGDSVVAQHILEQLGVREVDDAQDGSEALVSDGGTG